MRPVIHTLIDSVRAPIVQVFALLTDPARIARGHLGEARDSRHGSANA